MLLIHVRSFHPDFHDRNSKIQGEMMSYMQKWAQGLGHRQNEVLGRLTKDAVRNHKNIRLAGEGGTSAAEGTFAANAAHQTQHDVQGYVSQIPIVGSAANFIGNMSSPGGQSGHGFPGSPSGHGHGHGGGGLMANVANMSNMMGSAQGGGRTWLSRWQWFSWWPFPDRAHIGRQRKRLWVLFGANNIQQQLK